MLVSFYKSIEEAMKEAIPKTKGKIIDNNNPWWTKDLQKMRTTLNKLKRKMDKKNNLANTEAYKKYRNEYKKLIQKTRDRSWNDYTEKIDSLEGINKFRKIIEKHVSKKVGTLERNDGSMTEPGSDTLQHLAETHFTSAQPLKKTVYNENVEKTQDEIHNWNPKWVNLALIKIALKQFHNKKSPGPDGIKPIVLKYLTDHGYKTLLFIYKACLLLSFTPTAWKGCRIVFIPKPGKSTYKLAKSWRPISLTNYMLKGLERLCGWHMNCLLYTSPSPRDRQKSRMPSSA